MKIKPTRDIVLIKADSAKTETESGLLLQENWKTLPLTGTVISVGPDIKTTKKDDRVIFARYGTIILEDDLRLCPEAHILGVLDDN